MLDAIRCRSAIGRGVPPSASTGSARGHNDGARLLPQSLKPKARRQRCTNDAVIRLGQFGAKKTSAATHMIAENIPIGNSKRVSVWNIRTMAYAGTRVFGHSRNPAIVVSNRKPAQLNNQGAHGC